MGERVGVAMTRTKKLGVVVVLSFLLGLIITISEPDLQVLAELVPSVPNMILILSVACGVGVCLGCTCKSGNPDAAVYPKVCQDGPVFWSEEVELA